MKSAAILASAVSGAAALERGWDLGNAAATTTNCVVVAGSLELGSASTKCCEVWKTMWNYYLTANPTSHANAAAHGAGIKQPSPMAFVEAVRYMNDGANSGTCGSTPFTSAMANTNVTLAEDWAGIGARATTVATESVDCDINTGMLSAGAQTRECCHYKTSLIANSAMNGGGLAPLAGTWFTVDGTGCVTTECEADRKSPYLTSYLEASDWVNDAANTGVNKTCAESTWNAALTGAMAGAAQASIKDSDFIANVAAVRTLKSTTGDCSIATGELELGTQRNDMCRAWRIALTWYFAAPASPYYVMGHAGKFTNSSAGCDVSANIGGLVHAECETGGIVPTEESFINAIREVCDPDNYATHVQPWGPALNAHNGTVNVGLRPLVGGEAAMCARAQAMYDAMWYTTTTTTTAASHPYTGYSHHTGFVMGNAAATTTNCVVVSGSIELGATSTKCCEVWKNMWDYYLTVNPTSHANAAAHGAGIAKVTHMSFAESMRYATANAGTCGETPFTAGMNNTSVALAENWAGMVARAESVATANVDCNLEAGLMANTATSRECCHYKSSLIANSANNEGGLAALASTWFTASEGCRATECEANKKSPYITSYLHAADWVANSAYTGAGKKCLEATWNGGLSGAMAGAAQASIFDAAFIGDVVNVRERRSNTTDCSIAANELELGTQRADMCAAWRVVLTWYFAEPTSPYFAMGHAGKFDTNSAGCTALPMHGTVNRNIGGLAYAQCKTGDIVPTEESFVNAIREICDPDHHATHVAPWGAALNAHNGTINVGLRPLVGGEAAMCARGSAMYAAMWTTTTTTTTSAPQQSSGSATTEAPTVVADVPTKVDVTTTFSMVAPADWKTNTAFDTVLCAAAQSASSTASACAVKSKARRLEAKDAAKRRLSATSMTVVFEMTYASASAATTAETTMSSGAGATNFGAAFKTSVQAATLPAGFDAAAMTAPTVAATAQSNEVLSESAAFRAGASLLAVAAVFVSLLQ